MSMQSVPGIDDPEKVDFFNSYKLQVDGGVPYSQSLPASIIGYCHNSAYVKSLWANYKSFVTEKYARYQIIWVARNNVEIEGSNGISCDEKYSIMLRLAEKDTNKQIYLFTYYNSHNVNVEFYLRPDSVYVKEHWKIDKQIELYKQYERDDDDDRVLSIDQVFDIADSFMTKFFHVATNNSWHYTDEFIKLFNQKKQAIQQKDYLY